MGGGKRGAHLHGVHAAIALLVVGGVHEDLVEDLVQTRHVSHLHAPLVSDVWPGPAGPTRGHHVWDSARDGSTGQTSGPDPVARTKTLPVVSRLARTRTPQQAMGWQAVHGAAYRICCRRSGRVPKTLQLVRRLALLRGRSTTGPPHGPDPASRQPLPQNGSRVSCDVRGWGVGCRVQGSGGRTSRCVRPPSSKTQSLVRFISVEPM